MTSKDRAWTIPPGAKFWATQFPEFKELTEFTADDYLQVVHKGTLLEIEKKANLSAMKASTEGRNKGVLIGSLGTVISLVGAYFARKKLTKTPSS